MGNNINNDVLFQKVRDLQLPIGKYALFGSAALGIRNLKQCRDIDIIVTENVWDEFKNRGWEMRIMPHGSQYLCKDEMEMWKDWFPGKWDITRLIREAEIIDGLPFVKLASVLESKRMSNREKDVADIQIIEKFFYTMQTPRVGDIYKHFKGNQYKIVAIGKHSETEEDCVVYEALYGEHLIWIRPLKMFFEEVEVEGKKVPRFQLVVGE